MSSHKSNCPAIDFNSLRMPYGPCNCGSNGAAAPTAGAPDVTLRLTERLEAHKLNHHPLAEGILAEAAARIRELEAQREWRPIETAPRDGTRFLGADAGGRVFVTYSDQEPDDGKHWAANAGWRQPFADWPAYPVEWMPMPISEVADRQRAEASVAPNPGGTVPAGPQARSTNEEA
jgi:hypothetical protein